MKKIVFSLLAYIFFSPVFAQTTYDFTKVNQLLESKLPQLKGQGGGYSLTLLKDGKVIYNKSFGDFSSAKPVPIASATKWLSGGVIMTLVDAGKLSLDDKVGKYLPEFTGEKAGITVRQLFSHTSGLPGEGRRSATLNQRGITFDAIVSQIAAMPLVAKPGEELNYGGLSMQVAGRIAEKVSGMAWEDLFQQTIAKPLGMTQTTYGKPNPRRNPRIAGGAVSTADDYSKFVQMLLDKGKYNGKQILSERAVNLMLEDQTRGARIGYSPFTKFMPLLKDKTDVRYGIGVWREVIDSKTNKIIEAVSPGAFGFTPWLDTKNNLVGIISIQHAFPKIMPVYLQVKELVKAELAAKEKGKKGQD